MTEEDMERQDKDLLLAALIKDYLTYLQNVYTDATKLKEQINNAKEKNITFSVVSKQEDTMIEADKNEIRKVIINLLFNAINYSNRGCQIEVTLNTEEGRLIFGINGSGIADSLKISDEKYCTIGHSIGMYLCKKIIEYHKGQISITTEKSAQQPMSFAIPRKSAQSDIIPV